MLFWRRPSPSALEINVPLGITEVNREIELKTWCEHGRNASIEFSGHGKFYIALLNLSRPNL